MRLISSSMPRLVTPTPEHADKFLTAVLRSKSLHNPWVYPPSSEQEYASYLEKLTKTNELGYFIVEDSEIVGVVNVNEIVMGQFCSGYLGFYSFHPHDRKGYIKAGLTDLISLCFERYGFNRLEANVQPGNEKSLNLIASLGFKKEGVSENYLNIGGRWLDHERWAVLSKHWSRYVDA